MKTLKWNSKEFLLVLGDQFLLEIFDITEQSNVLENKEILKQFKYPKIKSLKMINNENSLKFVFETKKSKFFLGRSFLK